MREKGEEAYCRKLFCFSVIFSIFYKCFFYVFFFFVALKSLPHNVLILRVCTKDRWEDLRPGSSWRPLVWSSFPVCRICSAECKTRSSPFRCRWCTRNRDRTSIRTSTADRRTTRWIRFWFSCNRLGTLLRCLQSVQNKKKRITSTFQTLTVSI